MDSVTFNLKRFVVVTLITSIWINISEIWRYFALVIPRVKTYWNHQKGIASMDFTIFSIWGVWMIILSFTTVFVFWLYSKVFGNTVKSVFVSATLVWLLFFVLFWVGAANMGYSDWSILKITLPLSWIELIIACGLASFLYKKYENFEE